MFSEGGLRGCVSPERNAIAWKLMRSFGGDAITLGRNISRGELLTVTTISGSKLTRSAEVTDCRGD